MTSVGFGLWGVGRHAEQKLIPALAAAVGAELRGVATRNEVTRDRLRSVGCPVVSGPEGLLSASEIDVIVVALPTGLHHHAGLAVLRSGKHLLSEKPLAAAWAERQELIDHGRRRDLLVYDGAMFLHHPQFRTLARIVSSGGIGEIRSVCGRFGFPHLDPSDFRYSTESGGGALLDAGFYPIAAAVELLGPSQRVSAEVWTDPAAQVDLSGGALVSTSDGRRGLLEWGFGHSYRNELEVWGDQGTARVERAFSKPADLTTAVVVSRQDGSSESTPVPAADQFALMIGDVAGAVATGDPHCFATGVQARSDLLGLVGGDQRPVA